MEIDRNRNVIIKNYVSMTYDKALITLNAEWNSRSDTEEGYFNFSIQHAAQHAIELLRGLQTRDRQRSLRIDFDMSAQLLQLLGGKSRNGA